MKRSAAFCMALLLAACSRGSQLSDEAGYGPDPRIPPPDYAWIPPIEIPRPLGWHADQMPRPAPGLSVSAFATGLEHRRWLLPLPNGDVLVAESDPGDEAVKRPKDIFMGFAMQRAKAGTAPPNRISLLRDVDGDGRAEQRITYIDGLKSPFGMALVGDSLYVADTDALLRFPYRGGAEHPGGPGVRVAPLPAGPINHHWTKSLVASPDGSRLYVGVGSNSNVGENGLDNEKDRAAILEIDPASGASHVFASGLRNPVGMDWNPESGALWVVVNERDEIGDNASPDYITSVRQGGFYGWPWVYWGTHIDRRPWPANPEAAARAIKPDYAIGSHGGSLGFTFAKGQALGPQYASGAFVGQHGSWNKSHPFGYRVIFVPFAGGKPVGLPQEVLGGFLGSGGFHGRPVGLAFDRSGALLVADDMGDTVWRVTASRPNRTPASPSPAGKPAAR